MKKLFCRGNESSGFRVARGGACYFTGMTIKGNVNNVLTERKLFQDVVLKVGFLMLESVTFSY